jgi:hypothetical protein
MRISKLTATPNVCPLCNEVSLSKGKDRRHHFIWKHNVDVDQLKRYRTYLESVTDPTLLDNVAKILDRVVTILSWPQAISAQGNVSPPPSQQKLPKNHFNKE